VTLARNGSEAIGDAAFGDAPAGYMARIQGQVNPLESRRQRRISDRRRQGVVYERWPLDHSDRGSIFAIILLLHAPFAKLRVGQLLRLLERISGYGRSEAPENLDHLAICDLALGAFFR